MVYKQYSNEQYEKFLSKKFNDNFGISEDSIASWFVKQRGAVPVMRSYGVNKSNLLSTYIPQLKKGLDGGYVMFLIITVNEGGGAGNWINHYGQDTSTTGVGTMADDIAYINTLLNKPYPPAMGAPEVNGGAPYTEDVHGSTQAMYNKIGNGAIGKYYMPATMAGNAWVFGTKWCEANAVYFGNPYDTAINTIKSTGADPFGKDKAKPNPSDGSPKHDPAGASVSDEVAKAINAILKEIEKAMSYDIHSISGQYQFANSFLNVVRTFNNTYHTEIRSDWLKKFNDSINTNNTGGKTDNNPPSNNNNDSPSSGGGKKTTGRILEWLRANMGKSYDIDGVWGGQCVDMIMALNKYLNLNLNVITSDPSQPFAKKIWENQVPKGWHKVNGDPTNDANSKKIWDGLKDGVIVWFTNSSAGHVGVKSGPWAKTIQQNYNAPNGGVYGGPIVEANIGGWIESGGAGFLGAWVPDN